MAFSRDERATPITPSSSDSEEEERSRSPPILQNPAATDMQVLHRKRFPALIHRGIVEIRNAEDAAIRQRLRTEITTKEGWPLHGVRMDRIGFLTPNFHGVAVDLTAHERDHPADEPSDAQLALDNDAQHRQHAEAVKITLSDIEGEGADDREVPGFTFYAGKGGPWPLQQQSLGPQFALIPHGRKAAMRHLQLLANSSTMLVLEGMARGVGIELPVGVGLAMMDLFRTTRFYVTMICNGYAYIVNNKPQIAVQSLYICLYLIPQTQPTMHPLHHPQPHR